MVVVIVIIVAVTDTLENIFKKIFFAIIIIISK